MEQPVRILHVVRYLEQGGIQNLLMNLYRNINRNKIQFDFLVCGEGVFDKEVKELGGKIYKIPYITEIGERNYKKEIINFLEKHPEYKIVHSHLNQVSGCVMEAAKKARVPVRIAHSHTTTNSNGKLQKLFKAYLQSKINKNSTDLFACSKEAAKWLFKSKAQEAIIIPNAIDIEKFKFSIVDRNEIRNQLKIPKNCVVLGNIGRFVDAKNHRYLLKIFKEYKKINKNSILLLIGYGKLENKIKKEIKKMNLVDSVRIIEPTKYIQKYYSMFDYFVFPSKYEGLGMVLIEAQISGLKCFASSKVIPNTTKITENIIYIDLEKTPSDWAKQIPVNNDYLKSREDVQVQSEKFDIKKVAKKLESFYETKILDMDKQYKAKLKVLHYVPAFKKGGIESLVINLVNNMKKDVKFYLMTETKISDNIRETFEKTGGEIFEIPKLKPNKFWKHINQVRKIMKKERFDVVHCHSASSRPFVLIFAKKNNVPKRIYHSHSVDYENNKYRLIKSLIKNISIECSNILIACSENAAKVFKNKKHIILYNGIDTKSFKFNEETRNKIRKELNIQNKFVIGNVGRFSPLKNHIFMLKLLKQIVKYKENVKLLLVGDGPEKIKIEQYAKEMKLQKYIIFLGNIENTNEVMQAMDIFIFPSISEAMPLAPIEAQASGLKVIVSEAVTDNLKCIQSFIKIPLNDGIDKWCKEILQPEKKINRQECYKKVKEKGFDIKVMIDKLWKIYYK